MTSHGSCSQCSRPLTAGSVGTICPGCLARTAPPSTTPINVPRGARTPAAPGRLDLADLPLPAEFLRTPAAATRSGPSKVATADPPALRRPAAPADPPGYELVTRLGGGGMGEVYLAWEAAPQRSVAIKFLRCPSAPGAFVRFLAEVRALSRLDHPNIVKVLAVEPDAREPYFTMEYVPGGTLADLVRDGAPPVDPAEAARLMLGAAEAVAAAHAADVVHRDLKPSNILLDGKSEARSTKSELYAGPGPVPGSDFVLRASCFQAKVSDFGLAKRTDVDEDLTKTGPLGTAAYMSPEAAGGRHREVGVAADVYGLGATLYHLLTGRAPFRGHDRAETMLRVLRDPPPRPRAVRPDLPPGLEAVVVKAMEKEPAARYASAGELAADLRRFLAGQPTAAPLLSPWRRAARWLGRNKCRVAVAAGVLVAAAGLIAGGWMMAPDNGPDATVRMYQSELRAGRKVVLVPDTGPPPWHQCVVGPATIGPDPFGSRAAAFGSFDASLIELLTDPGVDRYAVTAELRVAHPPPAALGGTYLPFAGFYFGRVEATADDGSTVHAFLGVKFYDYLPPQFLAASGTGPGRMTEGMATFEGAVIPVCDGASPVPLFTGSSSASPVRFPAAATPPGQWRRVRVEVATERVKIYWEDGPRPLADLDAAALAGLTATRQDILDQKHAGLGATIPPWGPRLPFGVWCQDGTVAVRNVIVEPLP